MLVSSEQASSVASLEKDAPRVRVEPTDIARLSTLLESPTSTLAFGSQPQLTELDGY